MYSSNGSDLFRYNPIRHRHQERMMASLLLEMSIRSLGTLARSCRSISLTIGALRDVERP